MDEFNCLVNAYFLFDNQIVSSVLGLFIVLYADWPSSTPEVLPDFFDNPVFRVIVLFIVVSWLQKTNLLLIAAGLVVSSTLKDKTTINITVIEGANLKLKFLNQLKKKLK